MFHFKLLKASTQNPRLSNARKNLLQLGHAISSDRRVQRFLVLLDIVDVVDDDDFGLKSDNAERVGVEESEMEGGSA